MDVLKVKKWTRKFATFEGQPGEWEQVGMGTFYAAYRPVQRSERYKLGGNPVILEGRNDADCSKEIVARARELMPTREKDYFPHYELIGFGTKGRIYKTEWVEPLTAASCKGIRVAQDVRAWEQFKQLKRAYGNIPREVLAKAHESGNGAYAVFEELLRLFPEDDGPMVRALEALGGTVADYGPYLLEWPAKRNYGVARDGHLVFRDPVFNPNLLRKG